MKDFDAWLNDFVAKLLLVVAFFVFGAIALLLP